ncbi:hypothetical protein B0A55_04665 [Friedmanniomyces simplex]|uniref:Uncharacterized protein n=1 Tax=Friedmanniomyces simplex TaxID=329884 RepID=A0A4U0XYS4_9PEZI|nr:hypothetical protein B0A55_04665 [Friedmanniomyces simplex]
MVKTVRRAGKGCSTPVLGDTIEVQYWLAKEIEDGVVQLFPTADETFSTITLLQDCEDEILSFKILLHALTVQDGGMMVGQNAVFECGPAEKWLNIDVRLSYGVRDDSVVVLGIRLVDITARRIEVE